jgi:hypothetical protein
MCALLTAELVLGLDTQYWRALKDYSFRNWLKETVPLAHFNEVHLTDAAKFSFSHCFSDSFQADGWRSTSCMLSNLCFNLSSKEFLFYAKSEEHAPNPISIATFNYVSPALSVLSLALDQLTMPA